MKAIPRIEPKRNGEGLILFFPETFDKRTDTIEYYAFSERSHGTASVGYFLECKYVKPELVTEEMSEKIDRYEDYIRSLPDNKNEKIKLAFRLRRV